MTYNKPIIALLLSLSMGTAIVGCSPSTAKEEDKTQVTAPPVTSIDDKKTDDSQSIDAYETVGQIMEFDGDKVHIITGDIVDIFTVSNVEDFYLGQTVGVKDGQLEEFKQNDFDARYTSMGQIITSISGIVKSSSTEDIVLTTDQGEKTIANWASQTVENGVEVTIDYIDMDGQLGALAIHHDSQAVTLTVTDIQRGDTGHLMIAGKDEQDMEYTLSILAQTVVNFNYSDLNKGETITVYPTVIRESYPMQVEASKIILSQD